ncbi:hypothetical protein DRW03_16040 [Corallococcus sp. H22C18031201]|nr:hypothetical protein DRW03_16040 [Corallococcus sp. H22C18031201]
MAPTNAPLGTRGAPRGLGTRGGGGGSRVVGARAHGGPLGGGALDPARRPRGADAPGGVVAVGVRPSSLPLFAGHADGAGAAHGGLGRAPHHARLRGVSAAGAARLGARRAVGPGRRHSRRGGDRGRGRRDGAAARRANLRAGGPLRPGWHPPVQRRADRRAGTRGRQ